MPSEHPQQNATPMADVMQHPGGEVSVQTLTYCFGVRPKSNTASGPLPPLSPAAATKGAADKGQLFGRQSP